MKKINKLLSMVFLCTAFLLIGNVSCKEYPIVSSCNVKNPVKDLPWLKEFIKNAKKAPVKPIVYQYTYGDGETCYSINHCPTCDDMSIAFYDCAGNLLCLKTGATADACDGLGIDFENGVLIWGD